MAENVLTKEIVEQFLADDTLGRTLRPTRTQASWASFPAYPNDAGGLG